jgi:NhaA family Na+:H+ antiporter
MRLEAAGGIILLVAAVAALVWVNVHGGSYHDFWDYHIEFGVTLFGEGFNVDESLKAWVNDGLMVIFFFVVGMEIKRELVVGELRDPRRAALPIIAAGGGMVVPAGIFALLNQGGDGLAGWGIPVATDIAFVVGVLALFGRRLPAGLRVFLLTLAIADDIGGIAIIAVFYTDDLSLPWLGFAIGLLALIVASQRAGIRHVPVYVVIGLVLWYATHESGIHATIAGVALGLLTPARPFRGRDVMHSIEHTLLPYSSFLIVPLFALANAGVEITPHALGKAFEGSIAWGVILGLVAGKFVGVTATTLAGERFGAGRLPAGVNTGHVLGAALLAGIGFTVSLFIGELSFGEDVHLLDQAKIGVLAGSLLAGALGAIFLIVVSRVTPTSAEHGSMESVAHK